LTNNTKNYGEALADQTIFEKIPSSLTPRFDHVVITKEERDLGNMKVDELQEILEAHEQRLNDRTANSKIKLLDKWRNPTKEKLKLVHYDV